MKVPKIGQQAHVVALLKAEKNDSEKVLQAHTATMSPLQRAPGDKGKSVLSLFTEMHLIPEQAQFHSSKSHRDQELTLTQHTENSSERA